ncbi:MAG: lysine transporter LysE [Pseudomonadales bacterium RIFCSPLOWO2_12_59_9]|uniref:LysE family translocator n=1 Tax=Pseudomonas sp. TaxID=306 RepID=UPI0008AD85EF|nr:MAG: lysine transporter LysE [Pseudomonadales bacterium RIFCSPLOWO2_12_59_9]
MTLSVFMAFWAVSFLFVITPGADWAYAISAGVRGRVVVPAVSGLLLGHLIATGLVASGVGGLAATHPMAFSVLTVMGAAYLLWLGINMLVRPSVALASDVQGAESWVNWAIKGVCVSGLNPKVLLLFLALLPQFTDAAATWPVPMQIIALGLIHTCSCGVIYLLVGFSAQAVLQTRPQTSRVVSRFSGAVMIILAVFLLTEQLIG